ncbi:MAG TPA: leucyl aminopeptidase family protein [Gammaproteobacteria bacterium]|nr:leucyl aminopeptidase family protein [Gammaproteobacteria bacterium]
MRALPEAVKIKINQHLLDPDTARIDALDQVLMLLPPELLRGRLPALPYRDVLEKRLGRGIGKECGRILLATDLPNPRGTRVILACVRPEATAFERLTLARKLAAALLERRSGAVAVYPVALPRLVAEQVTEAQVAALLAALTPRPNRKSRPVAVPRVGTLHLYGLARRLNLARTRAEAEGNGLARWLTALPPNELTPGRYRRHLRTLARHHHWRMEVLDLKALARRGAGAFLAVAQGSPEPDAGIVRLRYTPRRRRRPGLALVGKGICFDTGGTNLKSARHMYGMHEDMQGSAVALGVLVALTRLQADFPVDCWLALAQNHIGPKAYKPNDVVRASNGVTIEVVDTDAEGRMVLADTLALASRARPGLILGYATLTGACVQALGTRMSGAYANTDALRTDVLEAGHDSGERVWPFPADPDYDEPLESNAADVKQCATEGEADHILAARFLSRFVPSGIPWVHIDLASGNHKGGLAHIPTDVTGFGVRFTLHLLLDHRLPAA